jgi:hypothetical protein
MGLDGVTMRSPLVGEVLIALAIYLAAGILLAATPRWLSGWSRPAGPVLTGQQSRPVRPQPAVVPVE